MNNIAIIGAGASGLLLSKLLSGNDSTHLHVFEKNKSVGTKLRASGGGKANLFNDHILPESYNHPDFAAQLLQQVDPAKLRNVFENIGLALVSDEEGRVYPASQFSQTVVDLLWEPEKSNVHALTEHEVQHLIPQGKQWHIDDYPTLFDQIVIATGSPANMTTQNRKGYNHFLTELQLKWNPLQPSLVGFTLDNYPRSLSGCRTRVVADLWQNDNLIHREAGEVTFKDDGISGIVILNMSAYYNRLSSKDNCYIQLNLVPYDSQFDQTVYLKRFHSLKGVLHPKLNALFERQPFDVRTFRFPISGTYPLDFAQVCHGGIDLSEITPNFALKRYPGLYVTGELLDMDGVCGGYNLFFAFASACVVAQTLKS